MTKRLKCSCSNSYQDAVYGKGIRIMNEVTKANNKPGVKTFRCTVCSKERTDSR